MWQILKAEFKYTGAWLLIVSAIALAFFTLAAYWEGWSIFDYTRITATTYFVAIGVIGSEGDKEKRTRCYARLPITPRQMALSGFLYITVVQLGMFLLWLSLLIFKPESATAKTFWGLLAQNGFILSLITVFIIHHHLGFYGSKKYLYLHYGIWCALLLIFAALIYLGHGKSVARLFGGHYKTAEMALLSTFLWLGLSWLSFVLCERRKSYLA